MSNGHATFDGTALELRHVLELAGLQGDWSVETGDGGELVRVFRQMRGGDHSHNVPAGGSDWVIYDGSYRGERDLSEERGPTGLVLKFWEDSKNFTITHLEEGQVEAFRHKLECIAHTKITPLHSQSPAHRESVQQKEPWIPLNDDDFIHNDPLANLQKWDLPDRILRHLYLGGMEAARNKQALKARKITHILTVGLGLETPYLSDFAYLHIEIWDVESEDIAQYFDKAIDFVNTALSSGGACLIHCAAGISRSTTMTCAYLMAKKNLSFKNALEHCRNRRFVSPNSGFIVQLKQFEEKLKTQQQGKS